jgi:hypothetical protein
LKVQDELAASVAPQVLLLTTNGAPLNATGMELALPFVNVMATGALLPPKGKRPKNIGDGDSANTEPVPVSVTLSAGGNAARESVPISIVYVTPAVTAKPASAPLPNCE